MKSKQVTEEERVRLMELSRRMSNVGKMAYIGKKKPDEIEAVKKDGEAENEEVTDEDFDIELTHEGLEKAGEMRKGTQPITKEPFELDVDFYIEGEDEAENS